MTKRERTILYLTIFVVIFAVVFNFFISPVIARYDNLNKEVKINLARLRKYRRLLSQKNMIQSKYKSFSATLKAPGTQKDTQLGTLAALEDMARDAQMRIVDVRPQRAFKERGAYKEIVIEVRTEGSMESYFKFIYSLENSLLLLRVKEFQLIARPNMQVLEGIFTISQPASLE